MEQKNRVKEADLIIRNHMIWSMGAGFIPVPIVDFFAVGAVQLDMIRQVARVYDVDFKETQGKAIITALTGTSVAQIGARAVKFIPGVGSVLGGVTMAVLAGASTYALGEVFKRHFTTGGTFLDFDVSRLRKLYDEMFEKGKKYAEDLRKEQETEKKRSDEQEHVVDKLSELNRLKELGAITESEFEKLKKALLDDL